MQHILQLYITLTTEDVSKSWLAKYSTGMASDVSFTLLQKHTFREYTADCNVSIQPGLAALPWHTWAVCQPVPT
jgi:hypothetical protein